MPIMTNDSFKSEIRESIIRELLEKVRKGRYQKYLVSIRLENIRLFKDAQIEFDFPVTALIGTNGSGKSTILGAAASAYTSFRPKTFFQKSLVGDNSMNGWTIKYKIIDKDQDSKEILESSLFFEYQKWVNSSRLARDIKFFSINRTVPATENPFFMRRRLQDFRQNVSFSSREVEGFDSIRKEAERILGKSLTHIKLYEVTVTIPKKRKTVLFRGESKFQDVTQFLYVGSDGDNEYSEFNFGSGESSVIRAVSDIEVLPNHSLVLIDELENGLHPVAVNRLVEYLIDVSRRKNIQFIFTTHSDYALAPLPPEAIWASFDGQLQQGKLTIEVLKAVTGRIDKHLAIYVEDEFAKSWVEVVLREHLVKHLDEIGIYAVSGDGNAVKTHLGHVANPAMQFQSICFIDGDSKEKDDANKRIFRMPGTMPELTVFDSVLKNLESNIALLTIASQRSLDKQGSVAAAIRDVSHTNRDAHLLFHQVGLKIGFVPEAIIRGAFLTVWVQENPDLVKTILAPIKQVLDL
ncbi:MAG: AAA family ATPase [Acidobacteriota bacterium]